MHKLLCLVVCSLCLFNPLAAQEPIATNWSIGLGIAQFSINQERTTIEELIQRYPTLHGTGISMADWGTDEMIVASEVGLLPTAIAIEFGFPLKDPKHAFLNHIELRSAMTFGGSNSYMDNREFISGNYSVGNSVSRTLYYLDGNSILLALNFSGIYQTRHFGKREIFRLGFGLGLSASVTQLNFNLYKVEGIYTITDTEPKYHSWHKYPANESFHQWNEIGSAKDNFLGFGYTVPFSFEFRFGRKRRMHVGEQFYFGQYFLFDKSEELIIQNSMIGTFNFRFDLE